MDTVAAMQFFAEQGRPVVIEGAKVFDTDRWTLGCLRDALGAKKLQVKRSPSRAFRYHDESKNAGGFPFQCACVSESMCLGDFEAEAAALVAAGSEERLYLQEVMAGHSELEAEFIRWHWEFLLVVSKRFGWGLPDSNELFIGMEGATTPAHFDERENLFFQVSGAKQVVLFPFTDYPKMYPFPTTHPCDRQSMVDVAAPDLVRFPRFADAQGHYTTLGAGDLLYIPYGWWHWLTNLEAMSISMSFWSKTGGVDLSNGPPAEFSETQLTRVMRNLESLLFGQVRWSELQAKAAALRQAMTDGNETAESANVRQLLSVVKVVGKDAQDAFIARILDGRFEGDWQTWV